MPTYRIAQDAGSIGNADDCWSVYKKDEGFEEVIAIAQTEALAESILLLADPPEAAEKIGDKYYEWSTRSVSSGYFKTIDEAIENFKHYESQHMTVECPEFDHVEVIETDDGFVSTTVSTLTWEEKARILDAAIQKRDIQ